MRKYPAVTITALSYCICAVLVMAVSACFYWSFVFPPSSSAGTPSAWAIPVTGLWCLTYYVLIHSITTYFLMACASRLHHV